MKPKKGEWIKKFDDVGFVSYICSECGFELELEDCSDSYYCVNCGAKMKEVQMTRQYNDDPDIFNSDELLRLHILKSKKTGKLFASYILHGTNDEHDGLWHMTAEIFPKEFEDIKTRLLEISEAEDD